MTSDSPERRAASARPSAAFTTDDGSLHVVTDHPPRDLAADLAIGLALADAADALTMDRFGAADLLVEAKPDLTPVTDADRACEQRIRSMLAAARPGDAVSGEEFGATGGGPWRWVIDPIDGTKNFVRGVPVWATLIGLLHEDEAVLGVVSAPALGRRWWAHRGGGAHATTAGAPVRSIHVSGVRELGDASLSYSSLGGWTEIGRLDGFLGLTREVWRTRAFGDFWSYMLLAEGAVDAAAEPQLSLWDIAALAPIVTEAGGQFTGLNGLPGVQHGNAVASNGRLHTALLGHIGDPA